MAKKRWTTIKNYILLHTLLLFYSVNGIFSKMASQEPFLSIRFIVYFSIVLLDLFVYAILWQQILKIMPLTVAFSNKAITVIWGMLWGTLFFKEQITLQMIVGSITIFFGIYLVVTGNE